MRKEIGIIIVCILSLLSTGLRAQTDRYAAHSVLAEGKWIKVKVEQTGIYKLTYGTWLWRRDVGRGFQSTLYR